MQNGPGKLFAAFAIFIVIAMVIGSLAMVAGGVISSGSDESTEAVDPNEDVSRLETQVAENPDDTGTAGVLAEIYASEGQFSLAIPLFERAVAASPDDGSLRLAFGTALYRSGNYFDAQIQLKKAFELGPYSGEAAYYLGALFQSGENPDVEQAREWFQRAIDDNPESNIAEQARIQLEELNATPDPDTP